MSTSKFFDRICIFAVILALLVSVVFLNGLTVDTTARGTQMGYESRLFDTSKVHTIDIVIDDWDAFLQTCQSEEYSLCDVVIDGERYPNVGIRGKGNTSLSTVSSMDSDRYSFKIEFDQYDSSNTYYGLDKLSLNNLIQDNTMMKDYLVYRMMGEFGVAAPLCSYVYITVNGEDWGLYLAVEAVEESFLQRNYGSDYGDLYKPDSLSMGGGRGNGKEFDFEDFSESFGDIDTSDFQMPGGQMMPGTGETMPEGFDPSQMGGGMQMPGTGDGESTEQPSMPENFDPSQMGGMQMPGIGDGESAEQPSMPEGFDPSQTGGMQMPGTGDGESTGMPTIPEDFDFSQIGDKMGGMSMGSEDVKLQYIDDDADSYSNIFTSAKTDVTAADETRLIEALKTLSSDEAASAVDVESVLRYFVVHNFVVNGDSYTGSMIHNYYLYEEDGQLAMIPWDYNLAFGTFQGGTADSAVNDDIDAPLSVTGSGRPMIDWLYASEEYTELYHQYFSEFLRTVNIRSIIGEAYTLIAPYVEQDPTKFCTYAEFEAGVTTLMSFCTLRTESVQSQLSGGEGSVDASSITLSDMGTMNNGGMGGGMDGGRGQQGGDRTTQKPGRTDTADTSTDDTQQPGGMDGGWGQQSSDRPGTADTSTDETTGDTQRPSGGMELPEGMEFPEDFSQMMQSGGDRFNQTGTSTQSPTQWLPLLISLIVLLTGLLFAFKFKQW